MAVQYSVAVRNARANAVETAIGPSPVLKLRSGAPPASCAAADTGTALITIALPADHHGDAANGVKAKAGTWQAAADTAGVIGHYRIYANDGVTCHEQGTVTLPGAGGDMTVQNTNVQPGQVVTVNSHTTTEPNA